MKKFKLLTMALVALTMFSCSKNSKNEEVITITKIILETGEYGTRSIEEAYAGAPTFNKAEMFIRKYDNITASGAEVGDPINADLTSSLVINLDSDVKSIKVLANYDGYTEDLTDNVNTRQAKGKVQIEGIGDITPDEDGFASVPVTVAPEMARVEIISVATMTAASPAALRTDIKVSAIYINNTKLLRTGVIDRTVSNSTTWDGIYAVAGGKKALYDAPVEPWTLTGNNIFGADKVVGYNIFTQDGGDNEVNAVKNHPHIIFKVTYKEGSVDKSGYLNITNLKSENSFVSKFNAGSIYQFDIAAILTLIEEGAEITPDPDPETTNISIVVTVANWKVISVTPGV